MCVIAYFKPGYMPPKEMLWNAVYNNWHSYGLVTRIDGKLDIKRVVPTTGEVDPQEVWDVLEDDRDFERFLHLRHNTAGLTNLDNCHPLDVYYNPKKGRQVVFMHNGTMYNYKSKKKNANGIGETDDDDGPSDTRNFTDRVLIPYLSSMDFGNGAGDIEHQLTKELIKRFWGGSNRGLLISSDQDPLFIDDWKVVGPEGDKFLASNDDYFKEVKRGPEHTRRLVRAEKAKEDHKKLPQSNGTREIVPVGQFKEGTHDFFHLKESLANIVNDFAVYDRAGAVALGLATRDELVELYEQRKDCLAVMDWVFTDYAKLYDEHLQIVKDKEAATKMIATLMAEKKRTA
jgi:hypothetical protein